MTLTEEKMEVDVPSHVTKRKANMSDADKGKKKTKAKKTSDNAGKSPIQVLHEECRTEKIEYNFDSIGNVQTPSYKVVAQIEGNKFEGIGPSKPAAKRDLAVKALIKLRNIVLPAEVPKQNNPHNFLENAKSNFSEGESRNISNAQAPTPMVPPEAVRQGFSQLYANRPPIDEEKARLHPVMVLSEVFPNAELEWMEGSGYGAHQYKVEAEVQGRRFFGEGRSKRMAKLNLAKAILLCMYDIHDFKDIDSVVRPDQPKEQKAGKKFPLIQLKELLNEDELNVDVVQLGQPGEGEHKEWHATIVVKGTAYEAIGKNRNSAKLLAAKKALEILKPKKDAPQSEYLNAHGVDVSKHPTMVFNEFFRDAELVYTESKTGDGATKYHLETRIERKTFKVTASTKKKAKLRLILKVFQGLKKTKPSEWMTIDVDDIMKDKPVSAEPAKNSPIMLLIQQNPQAHFEVKEDGYAEATSRFTAIVKVDDSDYIGEGPSKRSAKSAAARAVLLNNYGINPDDC